MDNRLFGSVKLTPAGKQFDLYRTVQGQYVVWDNKAEQVKLAEEGDFERNFFQLAFTYIRDKIPNLLDYMTGFEVVERNDEGTNAVGLFQFQLGGREIYAPVFYSNGELKGSELLYLKDQDLFRPNQENWVDFIMNKRPQELGEPAELTEQELGLHNPDVSELYKTDAGKLASASGSLAGMLGLAKIRNKDKDTTKAKPTLDQEPEDGTPDEQQRGMQDGDPKKPVDYADPIKRSAVAKMCGFGSDPSWGDLLGFIRANTQKTASVLIHTFEQNPVLHKWAYDYYGDELYEALGEVKEAVENNLPALETDLPKVQVFTDPMANGVVEFLNDDEKTALIEHGIAFADRRTDDEKAVPYRVEEVCSLTSPTEPGIYRLLLQGGTFCDALIIPGIIGTASMNRVDSSNVPLSATPYTSSPTEVTSTLRCLVYDLDENTSCVASGAELLVSPQYGIDKLRDFLDGLKNVTSMGITEAIGDEEYKPNKVLTYYILIDPETLKCTHALRTRDKITREGGIIEFRLNDYSSPYNMIVVSDKVRRFSIANGTLFVPGSTKVLEYKCKMAEYDSKIKPGTQEDFERYILKDVPVVKVSKVADGEFLIQDGSGVSPFLRKVAAIERLVMRNHMDVEAAYEAIKQASENTKFRMLLVKKSFLPTGGEVEYPSIPDPTMTTDPSLGVSVQTPQMENIPAMSPPQGDQTTAKIMEQAQAGSPHLDDPALNQNAVSEVLQAAETGQRDVFDVSMITQLLQSNDIDPVVQRYVTDLEKSLDRLGRLYFLVLWHHDEFADRFGAEELPELEDSLKNVFNSLGELTLKLKEREIDSDSGSAVETDLSAMI